MESALRVPVNARTRVLSGRKRRQQPFLQTPRSLLDRGPVARGRVAVSDWWLVVGCLGNLR